jgi:predicted Ser/Thr protein kinase
MVGIAATLVLFLGAALPWNALFWLPQGRFVSRWISGWAAIQAAVLAGLYFLLPFPRSHDLVNTFAFASVILGIYAQVSHYRKVEDPATRQQIKWAVAGICMVAAGFLIGQLALLTIGSGATVTARIVAVAARLFIAVSQIGLVVCLAIAIQRYRLWPVDLVINRSLVYGAVTLVLLLVFAGAALVIQRLLGEDQKSFALTVSIVAAMLAFGPVRQRAQRLVDRRLFGLRFDLVELGKAGRRQHRRTHGVLTGRTLGPYRVLGVLGKGGMGEVYEAEAGGQLVALKIVSSEFGKQTDFQRWLMRESQVLAALRHRNIVKFYEADECDGIHYLVLEYIDGRELSSIVKDRGRLSVAEVRRVVGDCAAALQYAHELGLVHRDIKPSNIMMRPTTNGDTEAVLMDFGVAKIAEGRTVLTSSGVVGTIQYMAPEQILAARTVDSRADIYALGVTVYEMLTGELPFTGNAGQLVFAHLHEPPPDPRALLPDLPAAVANTVLRAMEKKPERRLQTAGEFAAALNA